MKLLHHNIKKVEDLKAYTDDERFDVASTLIEKPTYKEFRRLFYPSIEEFIDAYVKINSEDEDMQQDGKEQMSKYILKCLDIKKRFKKE